MATIPKKVLDRFTQSVGKFQNILKVAKDRDVNESDTVNIITDILNDVFGYDKYLEITSEFAIRGTYCDLAIKIKDKVHFLIEVKAIGIDLKENHLRQAIQYGASHGIQWVLLTNGIQWELYKIRFEKPLNYDLVFSFNFLELNTKSSDDQEKLFILSKEGLSKAARENYHEKVQCVNRFVIGALIKSEPVLKIIKRELKKFATGVKITEDDIEKVIIGEVLKRDIIQGEEAENAQKQVRKFYRKAAKKNTKRVYKKTEEEVQPLPSEPVEEQ